MIRKLGVVLLIGLLCIAGASPLLAAETKEWQVWNLSEYEKATGKKITKFNEAPMLKTRVAAGELPPVEKRLPQDPLVAQPVEGIGTYGGALNLVGVGMLEQADFLSCVSNFTFTASLHGANNIDQPAAFKKVTLSEDGKTLMVYMREGLKWSDGVPCTADDVLFWWEDEVLDERIVPYGYSVSGWKAGGEVPVVEKINDYQIRFTFAAPKWNAPVMFTEIQYLGANILPKHVLKKYHKRYNPEVEKLAKEKGYDDWAQLFSVMRKLPYFAPKEANLEVPTLAPWIMKNQLADGTTLWERNPYFYQIDTQGNQLPYLDTVKSVSVGNTELYKLKVLSGEVDFASRLSLEAYPLLAEEAKRGKFRIVLAPTDTYPAHALFRVNRAFFQTGEDEVLGKILYDDRFSQALSLAIDRDYINETLFYGQGTPRQNTMHPSVPLYKEEWARAYADYDLKRANQLLDEMGLKWADHKKWRLRPDGNALAVELTMPTDYVADIVPITEIVVDQWRDIGVIVNVKPVLGTYQNMHWGEGKGEMSVRIGAFFYSIFSIEDGGARRISCWACAPQWDKWASSGGEKGLEPPTEEWKKFAMGRAQLRSMSMPPKERNELITWMFDFQAEHICTIGTVAYVPWPVVIGEGLGNLPVQFDHVKMVVLRPQDWYWKK